MKKYAIYVFCSLSLFANAAFMSPVPSIKSASQINLKLNKEVALKIVETILIYKFGENILRERPWLVSETEQAFEIKGTFNYPPGTKGGVVEIAIQKSDGAIIKLIRGK